MEEIFNIIGRLYVDSYNSQKIIELLQQQVKDKDQEINTLRQSQSKDQDE
jgi:predicted flavoprotein YhiN